MYLLFIDQKKKIVYINNLPKYAKNRNELYSLLDDKNNGTNIWNHYLCKICCCSNDIYQRYYVWILIQFSLIEGLINFN